MSSSFLRLSHQPFLSPFAKTLIFVLQPSLSAPEMVSRFFPSWGQGLGRAACAKQTAWGRSPAEQIVGHSAFSSSEKAGIVPPCSSHPGRVLWKAMPCWSLCAHHQHMGSHEAGAGYHSEEE